MESHIADMAICLDSPPQEWGKEKICHGAVSGNSG
jgi:hypothetical protein